MTIAETLQRCKAVLESHYQSRFKGLVLYGSLARQQGSPASDMDLLVLLTRPFDYFTEQRQIIDLLYPIQLETDRLISAKPAALDEYEGGRVLLYRNAKREGVVV